VCGGAENSHHPATEHVTGMRTTSLRRPMPENLGRQRSGDPPPSLSKERQERPPEF